jgi:predicted metal-dependent phosphoesterase TrpH
VSIDLHAHTTASDGLLEPAELVAAARDAGVSTLAITDHDTLGGVAPALEAGARLGVEIVAGVEISVRHAPGTLHLLGYFTNPRPQPLSDRLAQIRTEREERAREILNRLRALGAPVEWRDVASRARGSVGRPHIADALVAAGHAGSRAEAFERFIGNRADAFVPIRALESDAAVDLVRRSGGAPVLAHPFSLAVGTAGLRAIVHRLRDAGLVGIEVHRPDHLPDQFRTLSRLARSFALIPCGGSDFHRPGEDRSLGHTGSPRLPPDTADQLRALCTPTGSTT